MEIKIDEHLRQGVKKEDDDKKTGRQKASHEGREEFKDRLLNLKCLPRGPLVDAAVTYIAGHQHLPLSRQQVTTNITSATNHDNLRVWREVVEAAFDNIWAKSEQNMAANQTKATKGKKRKEIHPDESEEPQSTTVDDNAENDNWRTCTVTLKQVLHPDLSKGEDYSRILELLHMAQTHVTDVEQTLYLLAQIGTILVN